MKPDEKITRGLIIRQPWIGKILSGEKDWEMRSSATKLRGPIALIESGSGKIVGVAEITDVEGPMNPAQVAFNQARHRIPHEMIESGAVAKWNTAWVLENVQKLETPVPYKHPSGAVIWVNLDDETQQALASALAAKPAKPANAPGFGPG